MRMVFPPDALPDPDKVPDLPITVKLFRGGYLNGDGKITEQEAVISAARKFDRQDRNHDSLLGADAKAKALAEVIAATHKELSILKTPKVDK